MSLETWKEEFYKIPAEECIKEQALDHSITKWEGLRPENLQKHGLFLDGRTICQTGLTFYVREIQS